MTGPHIDRLMRIAFWACAVAVLALSLAPVTTPMPSTGWDKTNHLLAFSALAFLGRGAFPGRAVAVLGGLLAYGGLIEVLQSFTPDRSAEWADLLADVMGLLLGEMLGWLVWRHVIKWRQPR
jgi:VanZ family protein